jgi:ATP-dependent Clp protease ATP-binding subunit ClpA
VVVDPPSVEQATSILRGLRPRYERHHGVTISESALLAATKLSARYISGRHLPDKAIDCLDEAAAQVGTAERQQQQQQQQQGILDCSVLFGMLVG